MYRIIACDLDETLLTSGKTVSMKDREYIKKAREKGVRFVLATGRGYETVQNTLEEVGLKDAEGEYVISFNGAALTENKGNRLLFFEGITFEKAKKLFEFGLSKDVCIHVYTENVVYGWNVNDSERDYLAGKMPIVELEEPSIDFLKDEKLAKVLYMNLDYQYLRQIEKEIAPLTMDMDVSFSSGRYIEFNRKGVNKGFGLRELAAILGIDIKDTIAIGDNFNDLPMIEAAGLGVGVANTNKDMLTLCDYITEADHNHNAVSEVIEKFIL